MIKKNIPYLLLIGLIALLSCISCSSGQEIPTPTIPPTSAQPLYPAERGLAQMAAISGERMLLHGGWVPAQVEDVKNDDWIFDISEGWNELSPEVSPPTWGPLAYDMESNQVVLYISSIAGSVSWDNIPQVWVFDTSANSWADVSSDTAPGGLVGAAMVYDSESDRMVVFGGKEPNDEVFSNETWSYDLNSNTWNLMDPSERPSARIYPALAYSSEHDLVVLFGGKGVPYYGDTWTYDLNTNTWEEIPLDTSPSPRNYSAMVYDPGSDKFFLFGGVSFPVEAHSDLWSFDLNDKVWEEITTSNGPSDRGYHAMVTLNDGQIILFGGGASRNHFNNETWLYDVELNSWTLLSP